MDHAQRAATMDVQTLRALLAEKLHIIAERDQIIARHERTITERDANIAVLNAEIARLRRAQFAARSEKMDPAQRALFDETMVEDIAAVEAALEALQSPPADDTDMPRPRLAPKRRALPEDLERVETRHEPDSCTCGQCGGDLVHINDHVSEKLSCQPLTFFVRRDVYPQYACRACQTITAVPVPPTVIDRGIAAPDLLAQVVVAKYVDHLPLYRQEAIFARSGVAIPRSTQAEWIGACGVALQPLVNCLHWALRSQTVLHADETPVAMLQPGSGQTHRSYLFAYRSGIGPPIIVFDFCTSRSGEHARRFLSDYRGALMVDDYVGYKRSFAEGVIELGCWAHARRKFVDQHKASGSTVAREAIERIAVLYRIEAQAKAMTAEDRLAYRQQHAVPTLNAIKAWLDQLRPRILGNSGTANAIDYTLRCGPALIRYADDGTYPIDNNPAENAIRPIALGRKNWLFAGSETAGKRAAAIMSLLATAKANSHEPHAWLTDVLTRLPTTLDRDIESLLPHRWQTTA
jgi:transposase